MTDYANKALSRHTTVCETRSFKNYWIVLVVTSLHIVDTTYGHLYCWFTKSFLSNHILTSQMPFQVTSPLKSYPACSRSTIRTRAWRCAFRMAHSITGAQPQRCTMWTHGDTVILVSREIISPQLGTHNFHCFNIYKLSTVKFQLNWYSTLLNGDLYLWLVMVVQ